MQQNPQQKAGAWQIRLNKLKTYFSSRQNVVLLLMGIVLTITTVAPIRGNSKGYLRYPPRNHRRASYGMSSGYSAINYVDLFTSRLAKANLWTPLLNTVLLSVMSCVISILFGGVFAFLITRTNMKFRKYLSSIFIFPYIMPQWTLAVVWQNLFNSNLITGTSNGLLASVFNITMPIWWCKGLFPSAVVLGLHYAPFAYILIGGIFRNMDANLEEAATITFRHPPLEDHVPCDASHDKARNTLHHTSGIRQRNGQLSRAALPWPCDALHKVRVAELQIHGRGQHFSHTDDDIRRGDTASEPDKRKKQKELYHGHRQVRPDIQIQPGQIRQVHHSYNTYNNNLFYKHIPHSVLRL